VHSLTPSLADCCLSLHVAILLQYYRNSATATASHGHSNGALLISLPIYISMHNMISTFKYVFAKVGLHAIRPCTILDCTQLCVCYITYIWWVNEWMNESRISTLLQHYQIYIYIDIYIYYYLFIYTDIYRIFVYVER
jgi:hypothetical protein